jgi:hypothetical protein
MEETRAGGWVIETVSMETHPLESVTVIKYVLAVSPVAVSLFPPIGDQEYVNGGVPLDTETHAEPVESPLHDTSEIAVAVVIGPPASETCTKSTAVHPLASVTVTV